MFNRPMPKAAGACGALLRRGIAICCVLGIAAAHADRPVQMTPEFFAPGTGHSHPDAEPTSAYDMVPPVAADVLGADPLSHQQSMDARYFMSVFFAPASSWFRAATSATSTFTRDWTSRQT